MSTVATHPGGPFYVWYVSVYGYAPPATVSTNATRYLAWQQGVSKALAATIPYGTMGEPSAYFAGQEAAQQAAQASAAAAAAAAQAQQAAAAAAAQAAQEAAAQQAAAAAAAAAAAQAAAAPAPAPAAPAPAAPTPAAPTPAATSTTATYITTHPGGAFYEWYVSVYGYAPPAQVNTQAARYLAWQQGIPKNEAVLIPYGAIGPPGEYIIGSALLAPTQVTEPGSSTPVTVPAAAQTEAGVVATPTQPAPANLPPGPTASGSPPPPLQSGLPAGATLASAADYSDPASIAQQKAVYHAWRNVGSKNNVVLSALFLIGTAENGWDANTCNSSDHCGVFQLDSGWQAEHDYHDTEYWTGYAIQHGFYDDYGGLDEIVKNHPSWSIGDIVQACQGAGPTWADAAAYYNGRAAEANQVLVYFEQHVINVKATPPPASTTPVEVLQPNPTPPGANLAPVAWGDTEASGAVNSGYYQLQKTFSVWNPGFRDQLNTLANRPLEG